ncbi:copper chaperone PCu(A)C [Microbulbifer pacificus]|uniref:copper chaperone PCu(A)C n=1 Tax=Microbulbifer pacificus TaxID=407164 RepID=UPI001319C2E1|nr:copper chaperone PCu(A)C [Microbulbifer pacificus]
MKRKCAAAKRVWPWLLGALFCVLGSAGIAADRGGDIEISGYAREMPPGAPMGAAYLTLRELSGRERVLERVELPEYPKGGVELHTSEEVAGVSRMRALKKMTLPGRGTIEMRPGAAHLMIRGVALTAGQPLFLRLVFADGSTREVTLPVRGLAEGGDAPAAVQEENHHHEHHHG